MRTALCPGSFDPVTVGHEEVIRRACALFDRVIVGVLYNPNKQGTLTIERRVELLGDMTKDLPNVEIAAFPDMLLVEAVRMCGADVVLRGIRGQTDVESELQMARMNRRLAGVETLFLASSPEMEIISSSVAREIAHFGGSLRNIVPETAREKAEAWLTAVGKDIGGKA